MKVGWRSLHDHSTQAVDNPDHGIELVEPPPSGRDDAERVHDGSDEHPQLQHQRHRDADVAITDLNRAEHERRRDGEHGEHGYRWNGEEGVHGQRHLVVHQQSTEYHGRDHEVDEACDDIGEREDFPREVHLRDKAEMADQAVGRR